MRKPPRPRAPMDPADGDIMQEQPFSRLPSLFLPQGGISPPPLRTIKRERAMRPEKPTEQERAKDRHVIPGHHLWVEEEDGVLWVEERTWWSRAAGRNPRDWSEDGD